MLNFGDAQYLPFEGTGAVSSWTLTFPEHDGEEQKDVLSRLTDIIICVRYTARVATDSTFIDKVKKLVGEEKENKQKAKSAAAAELQKSATSKSS
jgi:hypothetical protein